MKKSWELKIETARSLFWIAYFSNHRSKVWWPTALVNYLVCKRLAVQTLLGSLEFVIQINLEYGTIKIWNLGRSWNISIKIEIYWSDTLWFYSLNNTLVTYFEILSIFFSNLYYLTRHEFIWCQLLPVSMQSGGVLNTIKKTRMTKLLWRKFKTTERYWFVSKNAKKDLWYKVRQFVSSPLNFKTTN